MSNGHGLSDYYVCSIIMYYSIPRPGSRDDKRVIMTNTTNTTEAFHQRRAYVVEVSRTNVTMVRDRHGGNCLDGSVS